MQTQPVLQVYVDIVFAANFVTDLAWLWATGSLAGLRRRWWRLACAAAVGAALAVCAYFPEGEWLTTAPGALLVLAFAPCSLSQALRALAYFIFSGSAMAGIVLLMGRRSGGSPGSGGWEFPSALVVVGLLLCLVGARYLWEAAHERSRLVREVYRLRIRLGDRSVEIPALLDTGNGLVDPLSGAPVMVVEAASLGELLPIAVQEAVSAGWTGLERLPGSWATRCRLVPFRAVGRPAGVLLAVVPDEVCLRAPGQLGWAKTGGLLGLTPEWLHSEGAYRALLPPKLVKNAADAGAMKWEGETG